MKKVLSLLLVTLMLSSALVGCGNKTDEVTGGEGAKQEKQEETAKVDEKKEEAPEVAEHPLGLTAFEQEKPLKVLFGIVGGIDDEEEPLWYEEVTRLTGIEFDVKGSSKGNKSEEIATVFASGEAYDIIYMNGDGYKKYQSMGMLKPVTEQVKNSKILSDPEIIDPKYWDRVTEDDGNIYVVYNKYDGATLPILREDWLQKLGLDAPTTLDEYEAVFKAFTEQDPDGNGQDDTYGYVLRKINDITPWMSAKGLVANYAYDENGKLYIPWATDEAAEVYDWLGNLYAQGYMEPNFATNGSGDCREAIFSDKAGAFVYWDFWTGTFNTKAKADNPDRQFEMKAYGPALDANGKGILMEGSPAYFTIPETAQEPDTAFALLEFLHTFEGNLTTTLGIEGYDYTVNGGKYELTEVGQSHAMNHGSTVPFSKKWVNPVFVPQNSPEAMEIVRQYGVPRLELETTSLANKIVEKYGVQAMLQDITGQEAVEAMRKELKQQGLID